jgi:hypothetical protein
MIEEMRVREASLESIVIPKVEYDEGYKIV